jgi:hypothetical protein
LKMQMLKLPIKFADKFIPNYFKHEGALIIMWRSFLMR